MNRSPQQHRVRFRRTSLCVIACIAVFAASLAGPSSAQDADPSSGETAGSYIDVVSFLGQHDVELPAAVARQFSDFSEKDQQQRLLGLGVDRSILESDIDTRPMPLVAELLRVLDPDAARPEVASDEDFAQSMLDAATGGLIADLQEDYSARLGFARWDDTTDGGRVLVIPVVGATQQDIQQIQSAVLPDNTSIQVESTDISYQDLRKLKDAVYASIRAATGGKLTGWSIGVAHEPREVFVRVDLSLQQNREALASISRGTDLPTASVVDDPNAHLPGSNQSKGLLVGNDRDAAEAVGDRPTRNKQTGDLLAGLAEVVRDVADSFVAAEIPTSRRTGTELVSFADAKVEAPDTDHREWANIRGGEWIKSDNGGGCTTNFLWKKGSDYQMGTAGHCSTTTGTSKGHRAFRSFKHRTLAGATNGDIGTVTLNGALRV